MTLWRLEWLRLARTRRGIALLGVYLFFGLLGPLTARYLAEIISAAGGDFEGAVIELPPPVPADGMAQYVSNAMQIGTLVSVVVAAGALAFDAIPEMGIFLRTRVPDVRRILAPRVVVTTMAVLGAFVVGSLAAWYETWALIGAPDTGGVLVGILCGMVFLMFVVALVAAVASRAPSVLSTVLVSIVVLLVLPILGIVDAVGRWLPSHLGGALGVLAAPTGDPADYLPAIVLTLLLTGGLLWLAARLARTREL